MLADFINNLQAFLLECFQADLVDIAAASRSARGSSCSGAAARAEGSDRVPVLTSQQLLEQSDETLDFVRAAVRRQIEVETFAACQEHLAVSYLFCACTRTYTYA